MGSLGNDGGDHYNAEGLTYIDIDIKIILLMSEEFQGAPGGSSIWAAFLLAALILRGSALWGALCILQQSCEMSPHHPCQASLGQIPIGHP